MGKVFTITEGLENMGALKTGGQGSVYKGRRIGEIITAVKLLPTPIYSESAEDKNFIDFQNEVQKLKKVNESPNPNVVKILSSGITETGAFPFIEMEFIEGPDLEELLKEPHDPVFTVKEVIKVAEQLSNALAHCHRVEVKHGDIKSNNVKFNLHTGNYVLLDFGLAVMSDEQRRTSLRHAGAIEFMAPEQNEGQMLFQTDVYSFGVVLYELLGGRVPFPLSDKGETARNTVMVAHMETPPPGVLSLRQQHLPQNWSAEKKEHEMLVPNWLIGMIYKCLEKRPEARFSNGVELHEYIVLNSTLAAKQDETNTVIAGVIEADKNQLASEKDRLQQTLLQYQHEIEHKDSQIDELRAALLDRDNELVTLRNNLSGSANAYPKRRGVSTGAFIMLLLLTIAFGALAAYSFFKNQNTQQLSTGTVEQTDTTTSTTTNAYEEEPIADNKPTTGITELPASTVPEPVRDTAQTTETSTSPKLQEPQQTDDETGSQQTETENTPATSTGDVRYTVASGRAYFHNEPDESSRRSAYMIPSSEVVLQPLDEKNGFIYVVFTNSSGQTSKGWLRKQDLKVIEE
jgi:serine/threonine-protein kinase